MDERRESKSYARRHSFTEVRSFAKAKEGQKGDYSRVRLGEPNLHRGDGLICQKKTRALRLGEGPLAKEKDPFLGEERRAETVNVAFLAHFEPIFHFYKDMYLIHF